MTNCGPTVLELRHERVDVNLTAGEALTIKVNVVDRVTGQAFNLAGASATGQILNQLGASLPPFTVTIDYTTSVITLSLTGAQTASAPLGLGVYEWLLSVTLQGGAPDYWVGGALSIYRTSVYSESSTGSTIDVVVGATILAAVSVGAQGAPGGQAYVNALPPSFPVPGQIWLMTPENHAAMYSSTGWLPLYPPTDNAAVVAGNALFGVLGLWLAVNGN